MGTYANAKSILRKTLDELVQLRDPRSQNSISGHRDGKQRIVKEDKKGGNGCADIKAGRRVKEAGIGLSVTVILGLGGNRHNTAHVNDTARILTDIDPNMQVP